MLNMFSRYSDKNIINNINKSSEVVNKNIVTENRNK